MHAFTVITFWLVLVNLAETVDILSQHIKHFGVNMQQIDQYYSRKYDVLQHKAKTLTEALSQTQN